MWRPEFVTTGLPSLHTRSPVPRLSPPTSTPHTPHVCRQCPKCDTLVVLATGTDATTFRIRVAAHEAGCCADTLRVSTSRTYDEARHGRLQHFGGRERDHFMADYAHREGAGGTRPGGKRRRCEGTGWEFKQLNTSMDISKGIARALGTGNSHAYFFRKLSGS